MNTHNRLVKRVNLCCIVAVAALGPGAAARSVAVPSLCARLASRMRRSTVVVPKSAPPKYWDRTPMSPWIRYSADFLSQTTRAYHRIASIWAAHMGRYPPPLRNIETLPGTDLFVANAILGSGKCLNSMFFAWKPGGFPHPIAGPQLPLPPCSRDDQWGELAMVLKRPAYIESEEPNPANIDSSVLVAQWLGSGWARPCRVSIHYAYQYSATPRYCGAGRALCMDARKTAAAVERRYHAWTAMSIYDFNQDASIPQRKFHFDGVQSAQGRALAARARRLAISKAVETGSSALPPWLRYLSRDASYFPVRLDHKLYLGAVDRKPYPRSESLFFLFRAPHADSHRLVPLAVFTMHWGVTGVKSIRAHDYSLP